MQKKILFLVFASLLAAGCNKAVAPTNTQTPVTQETKNTTTTTSTPNDTNNNQETSSKPKPEPTPEPKTSPTTFSMAEIESANSASKCWSLVNGSVYDLTSWIGKHPGGEQAILSICGKDGSSNFNGQHGGQSRPESELAKYKIGSLK